MCREEFVEKNKSNPSGIQEKNLLEISHIRSSYNSVYSSPYHQCITALMDNSRLLLLAICLEMKAKAQTSVNFTDVIMHYKSMSYKNRFKIG